jgi:hypothetical protein
LQKNKVSVRIGGDMPQPANPSDLAADRLVEGQGDSVEIGALPSMFVDENPNTPDYKSGALQGESSVPLTGVEIVRHVFAEGKLVDKDGNSMVTITGVYQPIVETPAETQARVRESRPVDKDGNVLETF